MLSYLAYGIFLRPISERRTILPSFLSLSLSPRLQLFRHAHENLSYRIPFPLRVPGTLFSVPFPGTTAFSSSSLQPVAVGTRCSLRNLIPGTHRDPIPAMPSTGTIYNDIEPTRIFQYSYSGRKVSAIIRVINEGTTAFSGIIASPCSDQC